MILEIGRVNVVFLKEPTIETDLMILIIVQKAITVFAVRDLHASAIGAKVRFARAASAFGRDGCNDDEKANQQ